MRKALNNCNTDISREQPDYVVRVVSDEGQIGRGFLDRFMDVETVVPTIVTTSQMLTTGVDVPTCKNVVLARAINSMTDFKQIIGRGTCGTTTESSTSISSTTKRRHLREGGA
jgi:type I restriction enzyme, R subunit